MQFDSIADKYGIEKLKTIGDAYMCAGGLPLENRTHPVDVFLSALAMVHAVSEVSGISAGEETNPWQIRLKISRTLSTS